MERGNVLVIGNSGVGKSTLINAVLGENVAKTGWGTVGTTSKLEIYEGDDVAFRIIDTIGFEPSFLKEMSAINAVKKWSKESVKEGKEDNQINIIWFCVDGTSSKLFPETVRKFLKATDMWKSVPIVVVITKSYSVPDRNRNIEMVNKAFEEYEKYGRNLKTVIPVVASTFVLNNEAYAAPEGIAELIEVTNELMPEGIKAAESDIRKFQLDRKRAWTQSVVGAATTSAVIVGAVPIPFADALILSPTEVAEINAIASIYGINKDKGAELFKKSIVEVGTVSASVKSVISALKAIPAINLAASAINSVVAGVVVAAIGEGTIYACEQVYLGNKTLDDIDWVKNVIESKLSSTLLEKIKEVTEKITDGENPGEITKIIIKALSKK